MCPEELVLRSPPYFCPSCLLAAAAVVEVWDKPTAVALGHGMRNTVIRTRVQQGRRHRAGWEGQSRGPEGSHIQEGQGNNGWGFEYNTVGSLRKIQSST